MGVLTLLAFLEFSKKLQNHEVLLSHILKDNGNYIQKSKCQNTATAHLVKMLLHEKKNFFSRETKEVVYLNLLSERIHENIQKKVD